MEVTIPVMSQPSNLKPGEPIRCRLPASLVSFPRFRNCEALKFVEIEAPVQIIPVLDLMHGTVVRGVAGERDSYRPIQSRLTESSAAIDIATSIRREFGLAEFYVADLDAIVSSRPNHKVIEQLVSAEFSLMLDRGIRSVSDLQTIAAASCTSVVVALESMESLDVITAAVDRWGPQRTVFSLDLKHGKPMGQLFGSLSDPDSPAAIVEQVIERGIEKLILLDLAAVGMGTGIPTLDLCRLVKTQYPQVHVITGGGVDGIEDFRAAEAAQADGLLIASALHDGRIGQRDLVLFS